MKKLLLIIAAAVWPVCTTSAQTPINTPVRPEYKLALGVLGTYQAVGAQAEWRVGRPWALKAVGARSFDYERRAEHGGAGIGLLTYYLPTHHTYLEPLVGVGGVYSWYHWDLNNTRGTLHDRNVGGAFGTNLRFSNRFRSGLNVFLANGFRAEYAGREMQVVGRRLLALPTLTVEVLL